MLQEIIDTVVLTIFGAWSGYVIAYTFELENNKYKPMVILGTILGTGLGVLKGYYF